MTPKPPRGLKEDLVKINMEELNKPMYFGAKADIMKAARILRKNMTKHEKLLWEEFRLKQIRGIRFTNAEVEHDLENVIKKITDEVDQRMKSPPWGI